MQFKLLAWRGGKVRHRETDKGLLRGPGPLGQISLGFCVSFDHCRASCLAAVTC